MRLVLVVLVAGCSHPDGCRGSVRPFGDLAPEAPIVAPPDSSGTAETGDETGTTGSPGTGETGSSATSETGETTADTALPLPDCSGLPNLLDPSQAEHQVLDDGLMLAPYVYGTVVSPVLDADQILFQLPGVLPSAELRLCLDYEVTGTRSTWVRSAIYNNMPPWDMMRLEAHHYVTPGRRSLCFDVAADPVPFSPTAVGAIRFWLADDVEGYAVHDVVLCEIP